MAYFKKRKKNGEPKCFHNKEIYKKIWELKNLAELKGNKNIIFSYNKVLQTLEKYPIPIISLKQASNLEGVGIKILKIINDIVSEKYKEYKDDFFDSKKIKEKSKNKIEDFYKRRSSLMDSLEKKNLEKIQKKKEENDLPKFRPNTLKYNFLTSLYCKLKEDDSRKFFTKEEIISATEKNPLMLENSKSRFTQNTINNLKDSNIICELNFDQDSKFSLTNQGLKSAEICFSKKKIKIQEINFKTFSQKEKTLIQSTFQKKKEKKLTLKKKKATPLLKLPKSQIKSYKLILIIDNREKRTNYDKEKDSFFYNKLKTNNIQVRLQNLPLGDFTWILKIETKKGEIYEYITDFIIERKIIDDLSASIIDGRYKDQKKRLSQCDLKNIFYLIEGDVNLNHNKSSLKTAVLSMRLFSRFNILKSKGIRDTVVLISKMHLEIVKIYKSVFERSEVISFKKSFQDFCKKQKKYSNLNLKNATLNAIKRIPKFGEESSFRIVSIFPTIRSLYSSINSEVEKEAINSVLNKFLNKNQKKILIDLFSKENYNINDQIKITDF